MATIANLNINLVARTAKLTQGLLKGKSEVKSFGIDIKRLSTRIAVGLTTAIAGAVVAFGLLVRKQFTVLDALGKTSKELGISTEALGAYKRQTALTGVEQTTLEKGLQRLVRRLGEAKQGYGEAVKGFEALGISMSDLQGLSIEDSMKLVADRVAGIEDPAIKAAAAYALFGRQGIELLNFLNEGSAGIEAAEKRLRELGAAFDASEVAKIEAANDAWVDVTTAIEGFAGKLAVQAAPAMQDMSEALIDFLTGPGGDFTKEWIVDTFTGLVSLAQAVVIIADGINELGDNLEALGGPDILGSISKGGIGHLGDIMDALDSALPAIDEGLAEAEERADAFAAAMRRAAEAGGAFDTTAQDADETLEALIKKLELQNEAFGLSADGVAIYKAAVDGADETNVDLAIAAAKAIEELKAEAKAFKELQSAAERFKDAVKTPFEELAEQFALLKEALAEDLISDEVFQRVKKQLEETALTAAGARADAFGASGSPGAFQRGSVAAYSKALELDQGKQSALDEARETNRLLGEIKEITEDEKDLVLP